MTHQQLSEQINFGKRGRCSVGERDLADGTRQRVLGFVPVARSNRRAGHSLISIIRLYVRLAEPDFERSRVGCETGEDPGSFEAITGKGE
jgi:hypothetical protein